MTKHLRFLFVMLLAMIWSAGWAAVGDNFKLVTDAKDLKAGDKIIIGSKASNVVLGADNGKIRERLFLQHFQVMVLSLGKRALMLLR